MAVDDVQGARLADDPAAETKSGTGICSELPRRLSPQDGINERVGRGERQRRLDEREDLALFEPHVPLESRAERVQRLGRRRGIVLEALRLCADASVVKEHPDHAWLVRVGVGSVGGKEHVLLDAEVMRAVLAPELEERVPGRAGVGCAGAAEPLGGDEGDMVVPRQRLQGDVTLHAVMVTALARGRWALLTILSRAVNPAHRSRG